MEKTFNNLGELRFISMGLDRIDSRDIEVEGEYIKDYKAIWNINKNKLVCITTKKDRTLQHNEVIEATIDSLSGLGIGFKGWFKDDGNSIQIRAIFDNPIPNTKMDNVYNGILITNNYNINKEGCSVSQYMWREVCSNGMMNLGISKRMTVTTETKLEGALRETITLISRSDTKIRDYINQAMEDSLEWKLSKQLLKFLITDKDYRKELMIEIDRVFNEKGCINRWDLYNIITDLATHGTSITSQIEEQLQNKAKKLLIQYPIIMRQFVNKENQNAY